MQSEQRLPVGPANVGILPSRNGTDPGLGAIEPSGDFLLSESRLDDLVDDVLPVHSGQYRKCDICRQRLCDSVSNHNCNMETLGERVKRLRVSLGLTQEQLASKASVGQSTITGIEKGARNKAPSSIVEIAHALDVDAYWLKTGIGIAQRKITADKNHSVNEKSPGNYLEATQAEDPEANELHVLIQRIPPEERKAMIAMLRTRFNSEKPTHSTASKQPDIPSGWQDVTEKPRNSKEIKRG